MWTKTERRWVGGATLILILLFGLPALWGWLNPPAGWQLYRTWVYAGDYTQYRAAMAQGHAGAWLIINRFTPEPHTPILQYPLYAALGHVARWLHLPLEIPYALASGGAIFALAFALYDCAAAFLSEQRDRRLAFLLALSIGPGWVISILQALLPAATFFNRYRNAFNRPEGNTFLLFAAAPHLPLALAILLCLLGDLKRRQTAPTHPPLKFATLYIFLPLLLGLLNPFSLPTLLLPAGLWWLWRSLTARRPLLKEALPLVVMGLASLPLVAYNYVTFSLDPFWGTAYGSQNAQISFPPDVVAIGFGLMGLLALAGALRYWRQETPQRLLPAWALCVLLMGYLPVSYQRRFSLGLAPALAILAVPGWRQFAQTSWLRRARHRAPLRIIGNTLLILLLWSQNIILYSAYVMAHIPNDLNTPTAYVVFQPQTLVEAAAHIDIYGKTASVLTCEELGNLLAGEIDGRVVLGHSGATLNVQQRRETVAAFFTGELSTEEQKVFLEQHGVSHILTSTQEPLLCGTTYTPPPDWSLSFEKGDLHVYTLAP